MRVVVHVDGGARGNPGPAGVGAVMSDPEGNVIDRANDYIGEATNNVAEYRAVLLGVELAARNGATEIELINDSELIARQLTGQYKVKHQGLKPLYEQAKRALEPFDSWTITSVPRAKNEVADLLVNEAIDARAATA